MKRTTYNLGKFVPTTMDMGKLYPIGLTEVLPGDSIRHKTSAFVRFSPMVKPVMHPIQAHIMHFFVPNRIVFPEWEEFITGGPGNDSTVTIPTIESVSQAKTLLDYYGIHPTEGVPVNALPIYGFNKIRNEFFRDQDLEVERDEDDLTIPFVSWQKDYATTARPWEQKGETVSIPLGDTAPIRPKEGTDGRVIWTASPNGTGGNQPFRDANAFTKVGGQSNDNMHYPADIELEVDLQNADAVPVNQFRRAFALQRFAENRARYGSRYAEYLRLAFGVRNRDARLQRPQLLGGGRQTLSISEVLGTYDGGETGGTLGQLGGHGIGMAKTNRYQRFFEEHGYIHTVMFVRPKPIYVQGMERHWLKKTKEDYYQHELAFIGQQPIYNNEIYIDAANGMGTFGFCDRYREYREALSFCTGEMRSSINNDWHLGRIFDAPPVLNQDFIRCDATKRIFAEQTQDSLYVLVSHNMKAKRAVPRSAAGRII